MGARNAKAVGLAWPGLPDRPWRVLLWMALTSLDEDKGERAARTYYAGHAAIAEMLGLDPKSTSDLRVVRRAVAHLVRAGALVPLHAAGNGRTAVYVVCTASLRAVDNGP